MWRSSDIRGICKLRDTSMGFPMTTCKAGARASLTPRPRVSGDRNGGCVGEASESGGVKTENFPVPHQDSPGGEADVLEELDHALENRAASTLPSKLRSTIGSRRSVDLSMMPLPITEAVELIFVKAGSQEITEMCSG